MARGSRVLFWGLGFALAGSFYLLLIDTVDLPELYAGAGAAALAAIAMEAAREQGFAEASISVRWLLRAWRPPARVPADIVRVSIAAFAQLARPRAQRGTLRAFPFAHGGPRRPPDAGRRALTEAAGSIAPNTIVIGIDGDTDLMLAHQLQRTGGVEGVDMLGLR